MLYNTPKLIIATSNLGKVRELKQMLLGARFSLLSLADLAPVSDIQETGSTFIENAILKAVGYSGEFKHPTLADDSGLEVAALGGRPGVRSARYGGNVGFPEKMALLLDELLKSKTNDRRARFVSAIAFADESGRVLKTVTGECTGILAEGPRGTGGFGYDPIFIPDGFSQTFGELPDAIKNEISHRARAFSKIIPYLRDFYSV